jgi:hypothetical protein
LTNGSIELAVAGHLQAIGAKGGYISTQLARSVGDQVAAQHDRVEAVELYDVLLRQLRAEYLDAHGGRPPGPGWMRLWLLAANAQFKLRRADAATELALQAWEWRPPGVGDRQKLQRMSVVTWFAARDLGKFLAFASAPLLRARAADGLGALDTARTMLVEHRVEGAESNILATGMSQANIVLQLIHRGGQGWVDGSMLRARYLMEALAAASGQPASHTPGDWPESVSAVAGVLPPASHSALSRLLIMLASTTGALALPELADACHAAVSRISNSELQRLDASLAIVHRSPSHEEQARFCEQLMRVEAAKELHPHLDYSVGRLLKRAADLAGQLRIAYERLGETSASRFWAWQRERWLARGAELQLASDSTGTVSSHTRPRVLRPSGGPTTVPLPLALLSDEPPAVAAEPILEPAEERDTRPVLEPGYQFDQALAGVEQAAESQNVLGLILSLQKLAWLLPLDCPEQTRERLLTALGSADRVPWRARTGSLLGTDDHLPADSRASLSTMAVLDFAAQFATANLAFLRPSLLIPLSQQTSLPLQTRLVYARAAADAAAATGRLLEELRARRQAIELLVELRDPNGVDAECTACCRAAALTIGSSLGAADLFDRAGVAARELTRLAVWLAARSYGRQCLSVSSAASGWLGDLLSKRPGALREFELVEQGARNPDASVELYAAIADRIIRNPPQGGSTAYEPDKSRALPVDPLAGQAIVQFLVDRNELRCVAAVRGAGQAETEYHCLALAGTSLAELRALHDVVWLQLRSSWRGRASDGLERLGESIVAPLEALLTDVDTIEFRLPAELSSLPIHAARRGGQYLIERYAIRYSSAWLPTTGGERTTGGLTHVLLAGWDPDIHARREAQALRELLDGFKVKYSNKAKTGLQDLLNPDGSYTVLHLASHGEFLRWPDSLESTLQLTSTKSISARDWLRHGCRASLVFVNACNIGRRTSVAGDIGGFPLVFRIKGAQAVVAALGPVPAEGAHTFASHFYASLRRGSSTVHAVRTASVAAINSGEHESVWAPYVHIGGDLHVPGGAVAAPADGATPMPRRSGPRRSRGQTPARARRRRR